MNNPKITEGISGLWHYHVSVNGNNYGLCGRETMPTAMTINQWGVPFGEHFPKKPTWCKECETLMNGHWLPGNWERLVQRVQRPGQVAPVVELATGLVKLEIKK